MTAAVNSLSEIEFVAPLLFKIIQQQKKLRKNLGFFGQNVVLVRFSNASYSLSIARRTAEPRNSSENGNFPRKP
jgi:hypothetical protein